MVAGKLSIAQAAAGRKRQQRRLDGFNVAARLGLLFYGDGSSEALTAATLLSLLRRRFFAVLAGFIDSVIVATDTAKSLMSLKPLLAPRFYPFGRVFERYAIADEHREYDRQYNPAAIRPVATCAVCDGIDHDHHRKNKHEQSPYQQSCDAGPANTVVKIFP